MPAGGEAGLEHAVHTAAPARAGGYVYRRHAWPVRVMHWINVVALTVLFMSGLQIFNAHPALNFGKSSYNGVPPVLEIGARLGANGQPQGVTRVLGAEFDTTGWLGVVFDVGGCADGLIWLGSMSLWRT